MGPFQEYEEKKSPEKGSPRSRIPRLVLHPFLPKEKEKGGALSESPLSEEEGGKESDRHSKHTTSTNSSCSGSDHHSPPASPASPISPVPPESKARVKRVRVMAEWHPPPSRNKRGQRPPTLPRGSEADFSSSSSGSLKTREGLATGSTGKKPSRSRGAPHIRSLPVFRPAGSPSPHDADLYAPYRTPPKAPPSSTNSSSNSSPTTRRLSLGRYHSCMENHGVHPPHPEQYLTPLQQKEVSIRHLRSQLRESESIVHDRESEVEELKAQLGRMREDWIEEECHRVEAQLALKEARKEIKQLRQVVETMKSSLMEKDKGIQKYFIDINIQNRKLESLLHSMELAQSDSLPQDFLCDEPPGEEEKEKAEGVEEAQGSEEMADHQRVLMSTVVDSSQDPSGNLRLGPGVSTLLLHSEGEEEEQKTSTPPKAPSNTACTSSTFITRLPEEKAVQTERSSSSTSPPDIQALLLQLLKLHGDSLLPPSSSSLLSPDPPASQMTHPTPLPLPPSPDTSVDSGVLCSSTIPGRCMEELDFDTSVCGEPMMAVAGGKRYWSNSFLVDLVAVAAPVLPTVAWLYSRHGIDGGAPVSNLASLIRGCCVMGLRSLRHHGSHGPRL